VIHALADEQDMRKMGGVVQLVPFTYAMMVIGSLALIGFPFLTGFYSKDVILEVAYAKYTISGNFAYWLGAVSALCTSYYSFRLLFLTFLGSPNLAKSALAHAHDAPVLMAIPLILLAFGSIFVGYTFKDMMIGLGTDFWQGAVFTLPHHSVYLESEYIPQAIKMIPLVGSALGAIRAYTFNVRAAPFVYNLKTSFRGRRAYMFLNKRWFVDVVYNAYVAHPALRFGYEVSFRTLDKGVIEILGPTGIARGLSLFVRGVAKVQSGYVYHYAFLMLIGLTFLLLVTGLWDVVSYWVDTRLFFVHLVSLCVCLACAPMVSMASVSDTDSQTVLSQGQGPVMPRASVNEK